MREYVVNRPEEGVMRRLLEREQDGPEAAVVRLAWLEGLTREEIAALRWEQVSFLDDRLELPDRMVPLDPELRSWLWRCHEERAGEGPGGQLGAHWGGSAAGVHLPAGPSGAGPGRGEERAADGPSP